MFEWWRRWRRKRAAIRRKNRLREAKGETELREFVYLDSISVHSLLASRLGPIATEQTENEARKWESKAAAKVGADLAAFDVSATAETQRGGSQSVQVLKKSIIQTTFKDLLELEGDSLLLNTSLKGSRGKAETVSSQKLVRGSLVELDVELDVEPVFRMATVVSSIMGFVDKSPELFDAVTRRQFAQGRALEGILSGLLGGLVPIRGRVLHYVVVPEGNQLAVACTAASAELAGEPLYLVGVAEAQLFWRDVRRVLFSRGRYKVLARIAEDGIRDSWTPVKLGHVLEQIVPGFSKHLGAEDWAAFLSPSTNETHVEVKPRGRQALLSFANRASKQVDPAYRDERMREAVRHVEELPDNTLELDEWRQRTNEIVEALFGEDASKPSAEERATLRTEVEKQLSKNRPVPPDSIQPSSTQQAKHFLDCEFVAIYW